MGEVIGRDADRGEAGGLSGFDDIDDAANWADVAAKREFAGKEAAGEIFF